MTSSPTTARATTRVEVLRIAEGWCPLPDHPPLVVDVQVSMVAQFPSGTSSCIRSRCSTCGGWWTHEQTDLGDVFCFLGRSNVGAFVQQVAHVVELTWEPDVLNQLVDRVRRKVAEVDAGNVPIETVEEQP